MHQKTLDNQLLMSNSRRFHIWSTLLMIANRTEGDVMFSGEPLTLKPGQMKTGRRALSALTNIPETTIERHLTVLQKADMIGQQTDGQSRLITIRNWDQYQSTGQRTDNERTTNGQRTDTIESIEGRDKSKETDSLLESFARFWSIWPEKKNKQAALRAWTKKTGGPTDEDREDAIRILPAWLKANERQIREGFLMHAATWINGRRWEDDISTPRTGRPVVETRD
jgi:hypothetical protein